MNTRTGVGDLWENYLVSERIKKQHYHKIIAHNYFWRTYDQQELDWLEDRQQQLSAYEFKWKRKERAKKPTAFGKAYPNADFSVITPLNYLDFIT